MHDAVIQGYAEFFANWSNLLHGRILRAKVFKVTVVRGVYRQKAILEIIVLTVFVAHNRIFLILSQL